MKHCGHAALKNKAKEEEKEKKQTFAPSVPATVGPDTLGVREL